MAGEGMILLWFWGRKARIEDLRPLSESWSPTNIVKKEYVRARDK